MSATTAATDATQWRVDDLDSRKGRKNVMAAAPGLATTPDGVTQIIRLARAATRGEHSEFARDLLTRARSGAGAAAAARLAAAGSQAELDAGDAGIDWWAATEQCLTLALDPADGWTPDLIADACDLAFHRTLQFDSPTNPLAADPVGFLAPFRANPVVRSVWSAPRRTGGPAVSVPGYEAVLVSQGNTNFAAGVMELLRARFESVADIDLKPFREEFPSDSHGLIAAVVEGGHKQWEPVVDVLLGQSRVIWAEWAQRQALVPSRALGSGPRFIVRLHAYEVFTAMAQFIDWRRVDALVVVSAAMANAVAAILPVPSDMPVHVIPNHLDAGRFGDHKDDGARYTLALVGHNSQVKDPDFALDVLDAVRRSEPRARLLMVGDLITATSVAQGAAGAGYTREFLARLQPYLDAGTVTVTGQTDDVAAALAGAGFILSTSRRESFHQGLLEGALSGCVAAVRDWPIMAPFGGPASFLPQRWVGRTPQDLADRVLAHMGTESAWHAERLRCRAEAQGVVAVPHDDRLTAVLEGG